MAEPFTGLPQVAHMTAEPDEPEEAAAAAAMLRVGARGASPSMADIPSSSPVYPTALSSRDDTMSEFFMAEPDSSPAALPCVALPPHGHVELRSRTSPHVLQYGIG